MLACCGRRLRATPPRNLMISRYLNLREMYPDHYRHFCWVHNRSGIVGTDFSDDASGLLEFIEEIGPYPLDMKRPTVGRRDHSLGYVRGNFAWQELRENAQENASRNQLGVDKSEDHVHRIADSRRGCVISDETKRKLSDSVSIAKSLIDNSHSDYTKNLISKRIKEVLSPEERSDRARKASIVGHEKRRRFAS